MKSAKTLLLDYPRLSLVSICILVSQRGDQLYNWTNMADIYVRVALHVTHGCERKCKKKRININFADSIRDRDCRKIEVLVRMK